MVALVSCLALTACALLSPVEGALRNYEDAQLRTPFYAPVDLPSNALPGQLLRSERLGLAPPGATAWRVVYATTDRSGSLVPASGIVVQPADLPPAEGRVVVSWAHPTTGAAQRCAPSVGIDPFALVEGAGDLLREGYAVVATDYPGMGVPGASSYLIGETEGHSVLDIVRAAHRLLGSDVSDRTLLWGHSQGGQAALFAAADAASYAPELKVEAVAVAAPAAALGTLLKDDIDDISGVSIGAYAFTAFADDYDVGLGTILTPAAQAEVRRMSELCLFGQNDELHRLGQPLIGNFLAADPTATPPWGAMLAENSAGMTPLPVPLFVAQGENDELVRPASTAELVARQCAGGVAVTSLRIPGTGHGEVAFRALPELLPWLRAVVAGAPPTSTC